MSVDGESPLIPEGLSAVETARPADQPIDSLVEDIDMERASGMPVEPHAHEEMVSFETETVAAAQGGDTTASPEKEKSAPGLLKLTAGLGTLVMISLAAKKGNRGGNYANVRRNLVDAGKANAKKPMPEKQKILRRRKRRG